jgi:hypothetical protein
MSGAHLVDVDGDGNLVVHAIDAVGNNVTHRLAWCAEHHEPVFVYDDGSLRCWWEDMTGHHGPEHHRVVPLHVSAAPDEQGPWE